MAFRFGLCAVRQESPLSPIFPGRPKSSVLPIEKLGAAAAGFGHTMIAYRLAGLPLLSGVDAAAAT